MKITDDMPEGVGFYGGPFSNFVGGPFKLVVEPKDLVVGVLTGSYARMIEIPTVENWYQAAKAVEPEVFWAILQERDTWQAKRWGNQCHLRDDWDQVKYHVMLQGLRAKFMDLEFMDELLATSNDFIFEASPTDAVWGLWSPSDEDWTGQNLLGKALMRMRLELRTYLLESVDV